MLFAQNKKKIALPALLATVTLFSACSRMQIVPEEEQDIPVIAEPSLVEMPALPPGTVIIPAVITQPAIIPQPATMPNTTAGNNNHLVQAGEGLYGIARTYNLNFKDLAAWNNIPPPYTAVSPGQLLILSPVAGAPSFIAPAPAVNIPRFVAPAPIVTPTVTKPTVIGSRYHTVSAGETLYSVARTYGMHFRDIASWNGINPPYSLSVGQQLLISQDNVTPILPVVTPVSSSNTDGIQYHTVQGGETLYSVARTYGRNFRELANWNNVTPPYNLNIGQRLQISVGSGKVSNSVAPVVNNGEFHTIGRSDTLYNIAVRYGQTVGDITLWNNLQLPYTLYIGQKLRISPSATNVSPLNNKPFGYVSNSSKEIQSVTNNNQANNENRIYHQVRAGESLANIADLYGKNLRELALWNGISPPYPVYQGQTILVHPR